METAEEIWADDLFNRQREAEDVIGYLECVAARPSLREDGHAHVLAVDTPYGHGKTFFLRRLARHLKLTHAVAFVDAWVDDLEDEPLVALAATLDMALAPWVGTTEGVAEGLAEFRAKAGRVAKIIGTGLAKRSLGFLITQGAVDLLGDEIRKADEISKDIRKDSLKDSSTDLINDVSNVLIEATIPSMDARIARFREGQAAIRDMKVELGRIVDTLAAAGMKLPIVIVIDELDRCRPTYAIKLLEEVKHLFDVSGVAFVLGMHGQQLAHSVSAAYGGGFDSPAYLRRFINRRYALKEPALTPLVAKLLSELNIPENRFQYPATRSTTVGGPGAPMDAASFISAYMTAYGLSTRDAYELMEMLQTSLALTAPHPILLAYLLPLIISHMKSLPSALPEIVNPPLWEFMPTSGPFDTEISPTSLEELIEEMHNAARLSDSDLLDSFNSDSASAGLRAIARLRFNVARDSHARPDNYRQLLSAVARFTSE